jgi:solute carrier family 41
MLIIIVSKELNVNPDNIATPMAASLGDLVTLFILANTGSFIFGTN